MGPPAAEQAAAGLSAPPRRSLLLVMLAGCVAAGLAVTLVLEGDEGRTPSVRATLVGWITLSYVLCGVVAWWRRPDSRFGPLMVATGFAAFVSSLSFASAALPYTVGETLHIVPPVLILHVFLAYPSGRLEWWFERALVATGYVAAVGLGLVRSLLGSSRDGNLLEIVDAPGAARVVRSIQAVTITGLVLIAICLLVARRFRRARPLRRSRELVIDCFVFALVMTAVGVPLSAFHATAVELFRWAGFSVIGAAPLAFLIALLDARLARTTVGELFVFLRDDPGPADLRDALARALGDSSLTLAYWLPEFESYADLEGRPVELPKDDSRRTTTLIEREGVRVAALVHDAALDDEPELLAAVTAAARIALENARLNVELRARVEELRGSRARILEAGHAERQRLERNLHDGAQHRLVALSLQLSLLAEQLAGDRSAAAQLEQARHEIDTSMDELREIARGIHPAVVSGHGLAVAVEQLAAAASVPVRLKVKLDERLPEALEVAAYYLISETLANVGKYAHASLATVEVARSNGCIRIEVLDDGIGGADTERGSGLRGLADRVEALGGRLRVWSPHGGGTRVEAEIPCAS